MNRMIKNFFLMMVTVLGIYGALQVYGRQGVIWAAQPGEPAPAGKPKQDQSSALGDWEDTNQDLRELFEKFLTKQAGSLRRTAGRGLNMLSGPAVDVKTTDKEMIVECEVPGWNKKDISVELKNNILVIRGTQTEPREQAGDTYYSRERWSGDFERKVTLPVPVLSEKVHAEQVNGVLVVRLARQNEEKPVRVQIG